MEHSSINIKLCLYFIHSKFEEKDPHHFQRKIYKKVFVFSTLYIKNNTRYVAEIDQNENNNSFVIYKKKAKHSH